MMVSVELQLASGAFVAVVDVAVNDASPYVAAALPRVLLWADRVFLLGAPVPQLHLNRFVYQETTSGTSATPPPGRPL